MAWPVSSSATASLRAGTKGLTLGLNPWVAVVAALVITSMVALVLGALSSRTIGIYFLMLTLTYAVIGYYVFGQVTTISGFGGITGIDPPPVFDGPVRLYYLALGTLGARLRRVPERSGARRSASRSKESATTRCGWRRSGFNVPLHRTLAFTLAGFVAGIAGVLNIWWNGQIDPNTISIGATIDLLIVAVIGGIGYLEGAWLGALVYRRRQQLPARSAAGRHASDSTEARFNTVVGLLVLLIMVLSPDGLDGSHRAGAHRIARQRGGVDDPVAPPANAMQTALPNTS